MFRGLLSVVVGSLVLCGVGVVPAVSESGGGSLSSGGVGSVSAVSESGGGSLSSGGVGSVSAVSGVGSARSAGSVWSSLLDGADTVIVATDRGPADALASGWLQGAYDAPLFFVDSVSGLSLESVAEIRRLGARQVIVLGGEKAVPQRFVDVLGLESFRVSGASRVETAANVAKAAVTGEGLPVLPVGKSRPDGVLLARAYGKPGQDEGAAFVDALGAGALSAATNQVLLLTESDRLHPATREALGFQPNSQVSLVGGRSALSDVVLGEVGQGHRVSRLSGGSRVETSINVAKKFKSTAGKVSGVIEIDGYSKGAWYNGLLASLHAKKYSTPVVLVNPATRVENKRTVVEELGLDSTDPVLVVDDIASTLQWKDQNGGETQAPPIVDYPQTPQPTPTPSLTPTPTPTLTPEPSLTPTPTPTPTEGEIRRDHLAEEAVLRELNKERTNLGLNPLIRNDALDTVANTWSEKLAQDNKGQRPFTVFLHNPQFGQQAREALAGQNPPLTSLGMAENIAGNMGSGEILGKKMYVQWYNSPGHNQNMLNPNYTHIGIGIECDGYVCYGTQNFAEVVGERKPTEPASPIPNPSPTSTSTPTPTQNPSISPSPTSRPDITFEVREDREAEEAFLTELNKERVNRGLHPYKSNPALNDIARTWIKHLADINTVKEPFGNITVNPNLSQQFKTYLEQQKPGHRGYIGGENIMGAWGRGDSFGVAAYKGWARNYKERMFSSTYTDIGIGVACKYNTCYLTQYLAYISPKQTTPSPAPTTPTQPVYRADLEAEQEILDRLNAERIRRNLAPYTRSNKLDELSRGWSEKMAKKQVSDPRTGRHFFHNPNYSSETAEALKPRRVSNIAENIAYNYGSGQSLGSAMYEQWYKSPGHNRNMFSSDLNTIGIGVYCVKSSCYGTQNFAWVR